MIHSHSDHKQTDTKARNDDDGAMEIGWGTRGTRTCRWKVEGEVNDPLKHVISKVKWRMFDACDNSSEEYHVDIVIRKLHMASFNWLEIGRYNNVIYTGRLPGPTDIYNNSYRFPIFFCPHSYAAIKCNKSVQTVHGLLNTRHIAVGVRSLVQYWAKFNSSKCPGRAIFRILPDLAVYYFEMKTCCTH